MGFPLFPHLYIKPCKPRWIAPHRLFSTEEWRGGQNSLSTRLKWVSAACVERTQRLG